MVISKYKSKIVNNSDSISLSKPEIYYRRGGSIGIYLTEILYGKHRVDHHYVMSL